MSIFILEAIDCKKELWWPLANAENQVNVPSWGNKRIPEITTWEEILINKYGQI